MSVFSDKIMEINDVIVKDKNIGESDIDIIKNNKKLEINIDTNSNQFRIDAGDTNKIKLVAPNYKFNSFSANYISEFNELSTSISILHRETPISSSSLLDQNNFSISTGVEFYNTSAMCGGIKFTGVNGAVGYIIFSFDVTNENNTAFLSQDSTYNIFLTPMNEITSDLLNQKSHSIITNHNGTNFTIDIEFQDKSFNTTNDIYFTYFIFENLLKSS
tara:strand:+ start:4240 stop:4890 length:651 start_codon:yes stop_codon:yes gene_type:complete